MGARKWQIASNAPLGWRGYFNIAHPKFRVKKQLIERYE
jgi:hypothetical protein